MKRTILVFLLSVVSMALWTSAVAQGPQDQRGEQQAKRALQRLLYPADLVMRNQSVLSLSEDQRQTILTNVQETTSRFTVLRWDLQYDYQKLITMIEGQQADEGQLLAQLDKVLDLEREVKRAQLSLPVKISSTLNSEQIEKLEELRSDRRAGARRRARYPDR